MGARAAAGSLVGRAAELALLEAALTEAAAGRGGAVLVAGEAGIGKTRLAGELAERARRAGATVLRGRCIDLVGSGLPYLPLLEALRPLRGSPALGDLTGGLNADATDSQLHLFEAALAVLDRLGEEGRPLLLVLEDLHWADASTLDLVGLQPEDAGGPAAAAAGLGLTARERQVLQHLARGYTNRQVAAELVISVKTASVHVSHILRKLGVSSRLEAAAVGQRLLGPTWS
jgi:predicted ATPase/DNA-binding CsgD family transcriptional regulator